MDDFWTRWVLGGQTEQERDEETNEMTFRRVEKLTYLQSLLVARGQPSSALDIAKLFAQMQEEGKVASNLGYEVVKKLLLFGRRSQEASVYGLLKEAQYGNNGVKAVLANWSIAVEITRAFPDNNAFTFCASMLCPAAHDLMCSTQRTILKVCGSLESVPQK